MSKRKQRIDGNLHPAVSDSLWGFLQKHPFFAPTESIGYRADFRLIFGR
jgi:hypothetical protein